MTDGPRKTLTRVLGALLLPALCGVAHTTAAQAAVVTCGMTITSSTVLSNDVGPCPGDGILIGADSVTLDLHGHTVSGLGLAGNPNVTETCPAPVPVDAGPVHIALRACATIGVSVGTSGLTTGVACSSGDVIGICLAGRRGVTVTSTVTGGTVTGFNAGVAIVGGSGNTVSHLTATKNVGNSVLSNFGDGIAITGSSSNTITQDTATANGPFDGIGLVSPATGNTISNNTVLNNNTLSANSNQDDGIRLEPNVTGNTVSGNTVKGSGLDGIALFANAPTNKVTGNDVEGNGFTGLPPQAQRDGDGIRAFAGANGSLIQGDTAKGNAANGIIVNSGSNTITGNTALTNNQVPSSLAPNFDLTDTNAGCDGNTWASNTFGTKSSACIS